jgi:hypothetical protein
LEGSSAAPRWCRPASGFPQPSPTAIAQPPKLPIAPVYPNKEGYDREQDQEGEHRTSGGDEGYLQASVHFPFAFSPISTMRLPSLHARYDELTQPAAGATSGLESHLPPFLLAAFPPCKQAGMRATSAVEPRGAGWILTAILGAGPHGKEADRQDRRAHRNNGATAYSVQSHFGCLPAGSIQPQPLREGKRLSPERG